MIGAWDAAVVAACLAAGAVAGLRWLRIAQREHYLAGSASRFALRWWLASGLGRVMAVAAVVATVATAWWVAASLVVAGIEAAGPPGLGLKGRTSPLAWTARAKRVAAGILVVLVAGAVGGLIVDPVVVVATVLLLPAGVDLVLAALAPVEARLGKPWVARAAQALAASGADVVAITGSYGKTTTKGYVAHLLAGTRRVLASPASFNNRMGLARAINENLTGDLDVFVAEMGTYGPGEIAELCRWIPPRVGVITAVGPVHLERFRTEDRIVEAKSEILAGAEWAVINVDDPRLARVADNHAGQVIRAGSDGPARVVVDNEFRVSVDGTVIGSAPPTVHPTNLACAVGVVVALGVDPASVAGRLATLPEPDHRRTLATGSSGVTIIDDTFNANPAGAAAALATLAGLGVGGKRVVVTPGMVELGPRQSEANRQFAAAASDVADVLIVVAATNRAALLAGADPEKTEVIEVRTREEAVDWVRSNLGSGDAVLYENDLPDHYP